MGFSRHIKSIVWLFCLMVGWCLATPTVSAQDWEIVRHLDWETDFTDVHFLNTQNGWAVGWNGVIARTINGGTTWATQTNNIGYHLEAVHFISGTTGWVVGHRGTILRTTNGGTTWTTQSSGVGTTLYDVYFVDANTGWIGGDANVLLRTTNGGQTWTRSAVTASGASAIYGIHFVGSGNNLKGWAVGGASPSTGQIFSTTDGGVNWAEADSGTFPSNIPFIDVHFVNTSIGWVCGSDGTLLHTSNGGSRWVAKDIGTTEDLRDIFFQSASNGWVVGASGTILHTTNGGTTWSTQNAGTINDLLGVNFVSGNNGWVVGASGIILRTVNGGTNWTFQINAGSYSLQDSYFVTANEGWAVGNTATILHTTDGGSTWERQQIGVQNLTGVDFVSTTEGWVIGEFGVIFHTINGGSTWTSQISGSSTDLTDVDFVNSRWGWVVGSDFRETIVLRTTNGGGTWTSLAINTNENSLEAISFVDTNRGWVVGSGGTIMRTENGGASWTPQTSGVIETLADVFFLNATTGWIAGANGTILHTTNSGATWNRQQSNVTADLNAIYFKTANEGWAVGEAGAVIHTIDGGTTWTFEATDTANHLTNVSLSGSKGYIVGAWGIVLTIDHESTRLSLPLQYEAKTKETILLPISVNQTAGIQNGSITITYDVGFFLATGAIFTPLTKTFNVIPDTDTPGELTLTFSRSAPLDSGSGAIFHIAFYVNPNVAVGSSTTLTFKKVAIQGLPDVETQAGTVTITGKIGDLNNDDTVDAGDAVLALRLIRNLPTPNPVYEQSVSDVNGDGQFNQADVDYLLRQDVGLQ